MIKIYFANQSEQKIGGGWTFLNYMKQMPDYQKIEIVDDIDSCDIYFISACTMVSRELVQYAKKQNKKIILRIDNIPRNSRNRNTGTSRLLDFANLADIVVYQSKWARNYIKPFVKKNGPVIYNGVDQKVFCPDGPKFPKDGNPQYLYSRFNRDETKQWHKVWYDYQMSQRKEPDASLWIAGQFSDDLRGANFDFFMGEKFKYWGIIQSREQMAMLYRSADHLLCPYYNDACSNTILEARACDINISSNNTGGTPELLKLEDISTERMYREYFEIFKN